MGLDVWVARNDRGRDWNGHRFTELPRLRADLPLQFDEATNQTIELIDVLWLKGNAVVAAFEIERTTSIYSGLLRMSDLIAMQPNLNIPLYLVAPDERRQKVFAEVNRPTFSRPSPPLVDLCRFIAFSALRDQVGQVRRSSATSNQSSSTRYPNPASSKTPNLRWPPVRPYTPLSRWVADELVGTLVSIGGRRDGADRGGAADPWSRATAPGRGRAARRPDDQLRRRGRAGAAGRQR
jgi:hypothetical protein